MNSRVENLKQMLTNLFLAAPAVAFVDFYSDLKGFSSVAKMCLAAILIIAAPFGAALLAACSLIYSVKQACTGEFKQSGLSLLFALGYTVMVPLSPVIASGSFILRGAHSLFNLARDYFDGHDKKQTAKSDSKKPGMTQMNTHLHSEPTSSPCAKKPAPEQAKSIAEIYKESRKLTLFRGNNQARQNNNETRYVFKPF